MFGDQLSLASIERSGAAPVATWEQRAVLEAWRKADLQIRLGVLFSLANAAPLGERPGTDAKERTYV